MAQHARLINGRLLLAGMRPWHEWSAADLLDMCDALREDEFRFLISLKAGVELPQLPDVDTSRIGLRTPAGLGYLTVPAEDDDEETWEPPDGADGGEGMTW